MTITRESLMAAVKAARSSMNEAQAAYDKFDQAAENNVFDSLELAGKLEKTLQARADEDCEGSYNCGLDVYEQEFMVDGVVYVAALACEYNRHDKTYYYVDSSEFTITQRQQ